MEQRGYVGVVGPGDGATPEQVRLAEEVGRLLARERLVLVTGGLGGVMAGAAAGCEQAGGTSIGILPGSDRDAANRHSTVTVPTGLGELRNGLLVRASNAVVAVGSSWGTLSEVALAVRTGVPVVLLAWGELGDHLPPRREDGSGRAPLACTSTSAEAVVTVLHLLRDRGTTDAGGPT